MKKFTTTINKMSPLKLLFLASAASHCSAFVPASTSLSSHAHSQVAKRVHALRESPNAKENAALEEFGKMAGSAFLTLTLSFSAINISFSADSPLSHILIPNANAYSTTATSSSITMSKSSDVDNLIIKSLEKETREVEEEAKRDAKKARVEKSREAFFEYEAKVAEQEEARIEAAEKKAELEAAADKKLVLDLEAREKKVEKEASLASSKKEKAAKEKEAKVG